jgi:uncharacterized membrane protein
MNAYLVAKAIHVLAAIAFVGPLFLTPRWLALSRESTGRRMLDDLHLQTSIAGWTVLGTGGLLLYVQEGAFLSTVWMQLSIGLYVFVQAVDHFWADKREEELAGGSARAIAPLRGWLIVKLAIYIGIAIAMVLKPSL